MRKELGTPGAVVGALALVLLFGGLALAIYPGWDAIGIWASKSDAPAWVQAVGSLIAISVAIAVPAGQYKGESLRRSREEAAHRARQVGVHVAIAERAMGALQRAEAHVARNVGFGDDWSSTLSLVDEADLEVARLGQLPFQDLPSYEEVRTAYNLLDALREASAEMRQLAKRRDKTFSVSMAQRQAFTFALGKAQISYGTLANQYIAEITHAQARKATN
ncbi:hypothetical protein [Variovorax sp. EBFNA2]|uniref:hypothetical protein n=1 Tax=Variovorax sp. EBFNA2 TaxID=3342097 RepID=UPI0029C0F41E|nr:hypothetical protein [Variovorax boronicumulans]WPG35350.1 hypothetical protein RZE79_17845 [Variovorax boronicumulans]